MLFDFLLRSVEFLGLAAALLILVLFWLVFALFIIGWVLELTQKRNTPSV